jgi:hypothetical protein
MARSEHLPIYKAAYDLCLYLEQLVRGFSRYHKYGLGAGPQPALGSSYRRRSGRFGLLRIADFEDIARTFCNGA